MSFQKALIRSLNSNSERTAIEYQHEQVTYAQLLGLADSITSFLLKQGLGKETIIGIQLQNRKNFICAMLGIINARCIFVPIDSALPENRLSAILQDLNLQYVIASRPSLSDANAEKMLSVRHFYIEDILEEPISKDIEYPDFDDNDALYIYFTSGSTGKPKGIIGKNCSLLQFVQWEIEAFDITAGSRVSQLISPYFDAFLRDVFVPLFAGGVICIPPPSENFFSPGKLTAWIDEHNISLIHCVPSVFRIINNDDLSREHFKTLRYVLLSGEKIIPKELLSWYNIFDDRIQLVNLYGPTETTMIRSCYKIKPEDTNLGRIPIGYPIAGTTFLIAGKDLKPCSTLVPGDLYIITEYATKGYLNNPALTQEKFIRINAGTPDEKLAFKTGDIARMLADGKIDLIGRDDRQVKIRGIRVELDEIENVLLQLQLVKNAVVIKHTEENGNESIFAFIIRNGEPDESISIKAAVLHYLEGYFPDYMIPSDIIEVSGYPLFSNGKINYQELLKMRTVRHDIVQAENEIEEQLLVLWKEMLGDKPISTTDSFHRIGGNSLSIMRLIARIHKEFGVRFSLNELFSNLTIRQQAAFIQSAGKDNLLIIPKAAAKPAYHLSSAQERIYYQYELNKESKAFNLPMAWEMDGAFDKDKIESILKALIDRHESLRTAFAYEDGGFVQVVSDAVDFNIEEIKKPEQQADGIIAAFVRPFDLEKAPLMRAGIIHAAGDKKILIVDMHHIICDGISQMNLFSEFISLYKGAALKPLSIQYKDYAEWEFDLRSTNEYLSYREFWLREFEGEIPTLTLPVVDAVIEDMSDAGGNIIFKLEFDKLAPLLRMLKEEDITVFAGLFSVYFIFLSQLTGQEDIIVGTNTSGRAQEALGDVVGMFAKTLPIRCRIKIDQSFKAFAKGLHGYLIQAHSREAYDLTDIVANLNGKRTAYTNGLFQTLFVFQNFWGKKLQLDGLAFTTYGFENDTAKYPLSLIANEGDDGIYCRLEYQSACFSKADAEMLTNQFIALIKRIAQHPDEAILQYIEGDAKTFQPLEDDSITFNF